MEITSVASFLRYYENVRQRTARIVACIPPEKLEWTYRPGKFTCGDVVRHLAAIERWMFAENVRLRPSSYPGHGRELADGWEAVMALFAGWHRESMAIFGALRDEDLLLRCTTPGGAGMPVWKWLRAMVEHEVHHRGQIYIYLGMLGLDDLPPLYGLTSEEVRARRVRITPGS